MLTRRSIMAWMVVSSVGIYVGCTQPATDGGAAGGAGSAPAGGGAGGPASVGKVLKLGAVLPLTGPNASLGVEMSNAAKLAVKQWNEQNKIPGYTLEYLVEDDASDAKQAVSGASRLVSDPAVLGIVAHLNSGCFLPASSIYNREGVMAITPAATNPAITLQGFNNIGRVCSTDNVQGPAATHFLARKGWKSVAIVHDKTQYGQGLAEVVQKTAQTLNIEVKSFDGVNVGDKDFKAILTKIKGLNAESIYFGGVQEEGAFLVRQMKELGMNLPFVTDDGVFGKDFLDNAGPAAEGTYVSFPSIPIDKIPGAGDFYKAYEAEYKEPVRTWGPYAFDVATILLESMKKAVEDPSQEPLRAKVVKNARGGTFKGVLGDFQFDANGDPANQAFSFYQVKAGKWEYLETLASDGKVLSPVSTEPAAPAAGGEAAAPAAPAGTDAAKPAGATP